MKKQIVIIHGGDTFETHEKYLDFLRNFKISIERYTLDKRDWKPWLREKLGEDYEVVLPMMPNKSNAQFEEWKMWFEKLIPFLNDEVVLIGHSLGGSFLAKYLSENKFPRKVRAVFLVAAVFDKDDEGYSLASFALPEKLDVQTEKVYLYHSKDDHVVPFSAVQQFVRAFPFAEVRVFEDRGHINQEEFPELLADLTNLK